MSKKVQKGGKECLEHAEKEKLPTYSRREIRKGLHDSMVDGTGSSVNSTVNGTFATPFALMMGADLGQIGVLNAVSKLAGTAAQPLVEKLIPRLHGRKRTAVISSLTARLLWVPILLLPFIFGPVLPGGTNMMIALVLLVGASQLFSSVSVTAWASWIGDFVPAKMRGKFFGKRGAWAGIASFFATLGGGAFLGMMSGPAGYAVLFGLAVMAGVISTLFMSRVPAPVVHDDCSGKLLSELKTEFRQDRQFGWYVAFAAVSGFTVQMASPFFTVSMLSEFKIGLPIFALVNSVSALAIILSQPYWGRFTDRYGDRTAIAICSVLIALVPGGWLLVQSPLHMVIVYVLSGFAWAGFDLAMFNYLLDVTPDNKRSSYIANYSMIVGVASFAGPLAGAALAMMTKGWMLFGQGLGLVFLLSFIGRVATAGIFMPKLKEVRAKKVPQVSAIFWKAVTVYPLRFYAHEIAVAPHWLHHRMRNQSL